MNAPKDFSAGFGSQFPSMASWAQMPQMTMPSRLPKGTAPTTPVAPAPPTAPSPVIGGVADYNTMLPRPGGVPATPAPASPVGARGRVNPQGFLAAILRATNYPGFGG